MLKWKLFENTSELLFLIKIFTQVCGNTNFRIFTAFDMRSFKWTRQSPYSIIGSMFTFYFIMIYNKFVWHESCLFFPLCFVCVISTMFYFLDWFKSVWIVIFTVCCYGMRIFCFFLGVVAWFELSVCFSFYLYERACVIFI